MNGKFVNKSQFNCLVLDRIYFDGDSERALCDRSFVLGLKQWTCWLKENKSHTRKQLKFKSFFLCSFWAALSCICVCVHVCRCIGKLEGYLLHALTELFKKRRIRFDHRICETTINLIQFDFMLYRCRLAVWYTDNDFHLFCCVFSLSRKHCCCFEFSSIGRTIVHSLIVAGAREPQRLDNRVNNV